MTQLDISLRKDSSSQTEEMSPEHATPAMPIQVRGYIAVPQMKLIIISSMLLPYRITYIYIRMSN